MENNKKSVFETLNAINVNGMTEKKNGLTYLSWASAIEVALKHFPDLEYEIERNPETGLPYWYDPLTGYMVFVKVTISNRTHEMWLPVLDSSNHAMMDKPYQVKTRYKTYNVPAASMADINRSLMRAIVKCLSTFGLGLYIYRGEDVPSADIYKNEDVSSVDTKQVQQPAKPKPVEKATAQAAQQAQAPVKKDTRPVTEQMIGFIKDTIKEHGVTEEFICSKYRVNKLEDLLVYQAKHIGRNIDKLKQMLDNEKRENLAAIVKNSKPKDMGTTFGDAICPPQQPQQEKTEAEEVSLESLGLSPADLDALTDCGKVFN